MRKGMKEKENQGFQIVKTFKHTWRKGEETVGSKGKGDGCECLCGWNEEEMKREERLCW